MSTDEDHSQPAPSGSTCSLLTVQALGDTNKYAFESNLSTFTSIPERHPVVGFSHDASSNQRRYSRQDDDDVDVDTADSDSTGPLILIWDHDNPSESPMTLQQAQDLDRGRLDSDSGKSLSRRRASSKRRSKSRPKRRMVKTSSDRDFYDEARRRDSDEDGDEGGHNDEDGGGLRPRRGRIVSGFPSSWTHDGGDDEEDEHENEDSPGNWHFYSQSRHKNSDPAEGADIGSERVDADGFRASFRALALRLEERTVVTTGQNDDQR